MKSFHVRTPIPDEQVKAGEARARRQEDVILEYLKEHSTRCVEQYELQDTFQSYPITSIRRALTNLHKAGRITCEGKTAGRYGVHVTLYRYLPPVSYQTTLALN